MMMGQSQIPGMAAMIRGLQQMLSCLLSQAVSETLFFTKEHLYEVVEKENPAVSM